MTQNCWYKNSTYDRIECRITKDVCTTCCCAHCEIAEKHIKELMWTLC